MLASVPAQKKKNVPENYLKTNEAIAALEKDFPRLMKLADVPGISAALIRDGKIVWSKGFGTLNVETNQPVTNETIFEAASLSKVVFAYGVLKLVDEGKLDLDVPLNKYLGNNYEVAQGDARIDQITARRVLSHTSGFPNWRADEKGKLPINFTPGEKFSYSGEGFVYLSVVVEKITGMKFEDFMQKTVFQPLGMTNSSYIWQSKFENRLIYRHGTLGNKVNQVVKRTEGNAAASLLTTADDYARLLSALLSGTGLKKKTWSAMFAPQIVVNEKSPQVAWGLGVGLETLPTGETFWHWGDNGNVKAFFTADLTRKNAIVYFANAANGLAITGEILTDAIGGAHPSISFLNYDRYDSPSRTLLKEIVAKGAAEPLKSYRERRDADKSAALTESQMNGIGYNLLRMNKTADAIEVFLQNTADFPASANTWDSLAEAYQTNGAKDSAIKYYEKVLELDPKNTNAVEQLKKLKAQ